MKYSNIFYYFSLIFYESVAMCAHTIYLWHYNLVEHLHNRPAVVFYIT